MYRMAFPRAACEKYHKSGLPVKTGHSTLRRPADPQWLALTSWLPQKAPTPPFPPRN